MKKVLIIEDRSSRKFLLRSFLKIYNYDTYIITPDAVNQMVEEEAPDYVYMNIDEPANGEDMKSLFENLRSDHRLRVRVVNLSDHKLKFSKLIPFESFDNFINSIHERIYKPLVHILKK